MKIPALLMAVWLICALAQAQTLRVDVPQEPIKAKPREVIFTGLRLHNPQTFDVGVQAKVRLPQGWQELSPPEALQIEAGGNEVLYLTVLPSASAPAQLYSLEVQLALSAQGRTLPVQSGSVPVQIQEIHQLEWQVIESPNVLVAQPYSGRFVLQNRSNVSQSLQLSATSRLGKVELIQPSQAVVAPGGVLEVELRVQPPERITRAQPDLIQLQAQSQSHPAVQASINATPTWYPANQTSWDRFERIPAQLQFEIGSNRPLNYSFQLDSPFSQGHLSLRLDKNAFWGAYSSTAWGVSLGKQDFGYTPLSRTNLQGWGFSLQAQLQNLKLKAFVLDNSWFAASPSQTSSQMGVGAQAIWQLQPRSSLSLQWGLTPALGSLLSLRLEHGGSVGQGLSYQSQLEYAWQPERQVSALEVRGGLGLGGFSIGGGYVWRGEQFVDAPASQSAQANASYAWPQGKVGLEAIGQWSAQPEFSAKAELSILQWQATYNWRYRQPASSAALGLQRLALSWNPTLDTENQAKMVLSLEQNTNGGLANHNLGFTAEVNSRSPQGYWKPSVGATVGLETRTTNLNAALAAGWLVGTGTLKAQASVGLSQGTTQLSFSVGYSLPLEVPVGLRPNIAELSGQVLDSQQQGRAGLVLTMAGLAAVTDDQGRFYFAALPVGTHQLRLLQPGNDQPLPSDPVLPLTLTLKPGEHPHLQLRLLEPARLNGRIVLNPASSPLTSLRGVRIEATNQNLVFYQTTDDQGRFAFASLLPGTWTFKVLPQGLPAGYALAQSQIQLSLVEGQTQGWELELIERIRTVPVQEGGTLEAP